MNARELTVLVVAELLVGEQQATDAILELLPFRTELSSLRRRGSSEKGRIEDVVDGARELLLGGELAGRKGGCDGGRFVHDCEQG